MVLGERTVVLGGERTLGRENNSTGWSEIEHWYWGERIIVPVRETTMELVRNKKLYYLGERTTKLFCRHFKDVKEVVG